MNNWTVLSNEEMMHLKGGMEPDEDPLDAARTNPNAFMEELQNDPASVFDWFATAGYTRQETRQFLRQFRRQMRRRRRRGC